VSRLSTVAEKNRGKGSIDSTNQKDNAFHNGERQKKKTQGERGKKKEGRITLVWRSSDDCMRGGMRETGEIKERTIRGGGGGRLACF